MGSTSFKDYGNSEDSELDSKIELESYSIESCFTSSISLSSSSGSLSSTIAFSLSTKAI